MRPGNNNNRRGRNRGPRKPHGGMPSKGQGYDGGSDTRVRGNVYQILEKYLQLARDAGVAGDRVAAENFLQHADHYYRVITTMNDGQRPRVGGREISVADVNVQNVSQGLSAALYSGGPSQPVMNEGGNAGSQQGGGNGAPRGGEGFNAGQNLPRGGNEAGGGDGDDRNASEDAGDDFGQPQSKQHRGPRGRGQGREHGGQQYGNSYPQGQGGSGNGNAAGPGERTTAAATPVADEQPDYPEHLIPVAVAVPSGEPGQPAREGADMRPRNRLRGRRPRHAGGEAAETGVVAEAVPTAREDSE